MADSSKSNRFQTPPRVKKTKDELERMTRAPSRKGNSNKVIIDFCMMVEKNRFSTPLKTKHVNPDAPGAPVKRLTERKFTSAKKNLFENKENIFSPYSRIL